MSEGKTLNNALIRENGRVYLAGNNVYGQIGNGKKENVNYFEEVRKRRNKI